MAKAYKCDLCGKFIDDCYGVGGLDIYPRELRKIGIDKDSKYEVKEVCKDCHEKIRNVAMDIFKENHLAATKK